MENLNAEQIIKGLIHCTTAGTNCAECIYTEKSECVASLMVDALALIKELTEENERLHASCTELARVQAENERLRNQAVVQVVVDDEILKELMERLKKGEMVIIPDIKTPDEVRAATVKEMAERFSSLLEEEYKKYTPEGANYLFKNGSYMMWTIAERVFHQTAKEMLEGKE